MTQKIKNKEKMLFYRTFYCCLVWRN